jgi:hypothetical protein
MSFGIHKFLNDSIKWLVSVIQEMYYILDELNYFCLQKPALSKYSK